MLRGWPLLLFAVALLAGCFSDTSEPVQEADEAVVLMWHGARLSGPPSDMMNNPPPFMERPARPTCGSENCERIPFTVPDGGRDVAVAIEWEAQDETYPSTSLPGGYLGSANLGLDLAILRDGQVIADGPESFHYAGVTILHAAEPGDYEAEVVARWGTGSYIGVVRLQEHDGRGVQRGLPDLVMLPPDHLTFQVPLAHEADAVLSRAATGCGPDEVAEDQEMRCLRFAGILGNQGPGDFELILRYDEATASMAGEGQWEQLVFQPDGSEAVVPAGSAEYHAVHGHFHVLDLVETTLYTYDEASRQRGDDTGFGRKTGFCIIDGGLVDPRAPAALPKYDGTGCCYLAGFCQLDMATHPHFRMGMSAGWYDIYPWWRADQYVEVSGLPDGTYEMVSVVDPRGLMQEARSDNNEAGTIFRMEGGRVTMLEQWTQADVGPHPDADWGYQGRSG